MKAPEPLSPPEEPGNPVGNLPLHIRFRLLRREIEHRARNLLLKLLVVLLAGKKRKLTGSAWRTERVLVVRTGKALGDAVMSLVLLPELQRMFPGVRVDFLVRSNIAGLFKSLEGPGEILVLNPKFLTSPGKMISLLRRLWGGGYDLVIACDNPHKSSLTTLLLCQLPGARSIIGFENQESRGFLTDPVVPIPGEKTTVNLLRLLTSSGESTPLGTSAIPKLELKEDVQAAADSLGIAFARPIILFIPGHWRKSWPLECFFDLATRLVREGKREVLLAFGPGDRRRHSAAVSAWLKQIGEKADLLPECNLSILAGILTRRCDFFISNDCGPYHLAVATGTKTIGMFLTAEGKRDFGYEEEGRHWSFLGDDPKRCIQEVLEVVGS
jgi:ADP-heptose:LPS heptosyltransferase